MRNTHFVVLLILLLACGMAAQAGVVFTDDFSTDPFAAPARWTSNGIGSNAAYNEPGGNVGLGYSYITTTTANDVELNTISGSASWTFDFQINDPTLAGPFVATNAFRNPGVDNGYEITCYQSGIGGGDVSWYRDARLTQVIAGSTNHTPLESGTWYTFKTEIFDDGTQSLVTCTLTDRATGGARGYVVFADVSASRLTVHKGLLIKGYIGNGGTEGPYIDNVSASSSSTVRPSFSSESGTYVCAAGETTFPVKITCATAGASINYTTDGSDPTPTHGTAVSSGASVNVPDGATLKAVAWTNTADPSGIKSGTYALTPSWCEDFSTDPLADPARWELGGSPAWWDSSAQTIVGSYGRISSTSNAVLNMNQPASYEFDFKYRSNQGPQMRFYAFSSPGVAGYEFLPYPDGNWYNDGRLTLVGGSATHQVYGTTDIWYHVKVVLQDDTANSRSLITATITRKSDNAQVGYIQSADSTATRLKLQKGVAVFAYGGDNSLGTDVDNICVKGSASTPLAPLTFSPDGGTVICSPGETVVPVTMFCTTPGAAIRYTTDGTTPTTTTGTLVSSGAKVTLSLGTTLKAIAYASGYAPVTKSSTYSALQAGWCDDFSTDPIAGGRWTSTPFPGWAPASWNSVDQVETANRGDLSTVVGYSLNPLWPASFQWDFKFYSTMGPSIGGYAFSNLAAGEPGYGMQPYPGYDWFYDGRLTKIGGSGPCGAWTVGAWYTLKIEMFDDVANNRSVVNATVYNKSDGSVKEYIQFADASATRLRAHKGVSIFSYPGDDQLGGPDIDNVCITGSAAEPAALPAFSPDGGTQICAAGETSVPVTISSSTSGASIRYTTDGSDPTPTTGTAVANGATVSVPDGTTLKAVAIATGYACSAVKSAAYTLEAGFCEDFSTDPFAGGRWTTDLNGMGWGAYATWNATDQVVTGFYSYVRTANAFNMSTKWGASVQWDYKFYATDMGEQMDGYAFSNPAIGENGYRVGTYNGYQNTANWYDSRLTMIGGSQNFAWYSPGVWYTMKLDMLDDVANNRSVVTATVTRKSDGGQLAYIQLADISSTRLKVQKGVTIHSYMGDTWPGGDDIDNVCVSSSIAQPALQPAFTPDGGTQICSDGETSVPVTITTSTAGASIRYTTDGSNPTPSYGTLVANGSTVTVSDGTTLKAIAVATGYASSPVKSGIYTLQAGFCEDFSTDPIAGGRWINIGYGGLASWNEVAQTETGNYGLLRTANNFNLSTKWGANVQWDFMFSNLLGVQMRAYAFTDPAAGVAGYELSPYSGSALWIYDSRLTIIGGSDVVPMWTAGEWYTMKLNMLDDTANDRSVVTATVVRRSDSFVMDYVQFADTSAGRLKVQKGVSIFTYQGDGTETVPMQAGPELDNVCVSSSILEPVANVVFSPDGGAFIAKPGTTTEKIAMSCATAGSTIRYTTDGTDPTSTTGTVYSTQVTVSDGSTLKARAFKTGFASSPVHAVTYDLLGNSYSEDFSTDPYASPARWSTAPPPLSWWDPAVWSSELQVMLLHYSGISPLPAFSLDTQSGVSYQWDSVHHSTLGVQMRTAPFCNPGVDVGYELHPYNGSWSIDPRLTQVAGDTNFPLFVTKVWYTTKVDVLDDVANNQSLITVTVNRLSDGTQIATGQFADTSASRLRVQRGLNIIGYYGDDGSAGPEVDNVAVAYSSVATPVLGSSGGTLLGPQNVSVTCSTSGAVIRYTTDGSIPTATNGAVIASGGSVAVSGALTLRARAFKADSLPSNVAAATFQIGGLNRPEIIPYGTGFTLDGNLTEWSESDFIPLDQVYDVFYDPSVAYQDKVDMLNWDVPEAYSAAKWGSDGKLHVAVKVYDNSQFFTTSYDDWYTRDAVEIYIHTTGTGPADYSVTQADAQQYSVGIKAGTLNEVWTDIGYKTDVPASANFSAAGKVVGNWIYYEAVITPFKHFSLDGVGLIPSPLSAGMFVGFDVAVTSNDGAGYLGQKAENMMTGKSMNYSQFGQHLLLSGSLSIAGAKQGADGTGVSISGVVTGVFGDTFYIEQSDRNSGIRVSKSGHGLVVGQIANVVGIVQTLPSGERYIFALTTASSGSGTIAPLAMTNKALGGGNATGQLGVAGGTGLNNIGLLIKTSGKVTEKGTDWFKIDDGSGVSLKIIGTVPTGNPFVAVTGASSCEKPGSDMLRAVLATEIVTE